MKSPIRLQPKQAGEATYDSSDLTAIGTLQRPKHQLWKCVRALEAWQTFASLVIVGVLDIYLYSQECLD
jgi:hypothetical protein